MDLTPNSDALDAYRRLRMAEANYAEGSGGPMEDVLWMELQAAINAVNLVIAREKGLRREAG